MKVYIGTKVVSAEPSEDMGGSQGYTVIYEDGYTSWSPKAVFERCYREVTPAERVLVKSPEGARFAKREGI